MVGKFKSIALAGALIMAVSPAFAQMMDLPVIGNIDLDPFHIMTPAPAAAPAAPDDDEEASHDASQDDAQEDDEEENDDEKEEDDVILLFLTSFMQMPAPWCGHFVLSLANAVSALDNKPGTKFAAIDLPRRGGCIAVSRHD